MTYYQEFPGVGEDDRLTPDDRVAVLEVLAAEVALKYLRRPYSEALITACELALRAYPVAESCELRARQELVS